MSADWRRTAGMSASAVLAGLGGLHVYWAAGGQRGRAAVIPTTEQGRALLSPGPAASVAVAGLLVTAATSYAASASNARPRRLWRTTTATAACVLGARAVGDRRHLGFTKTVRGTPFARRDTTVYAPLCALLAVAGAAAVSASKPA